jgi:hypothetical protein
MKIANPIYDVVFKHLMEDIEIAKAILSAILNVEIVSLEIKPQELIRRTASGLRLLRIDFKAAIKHKDGSLKIVLIEIQKSKKGYELPRFRRYLANYYSKLEDVINENGENVKVSLPITTIYFLGFRLVKVTVPVLMVKREYYNALTNRKLKVREDFIEHLSHDLYAIQIPRLNMVAQTELEKILDVFSQKKYKTSDARILEYTGDDSNPLVKRIVNKLNMALYDEQMLEAMYAEEEVENELDELNKKIEAERKAKEEAQRGKEELQKAKETIERAAQKREEELLAIIAKLSAQVESLPKNK